MSADPSLSEKLKRLSESWAADAGPKLVELSVLLSALAQNEAADAAQLRLAIRLAHSLAGGAGTVGHPDVSRSLLPLELRLAAIAGREALNSYDRRVLRKVVRRIPGLIAGLAS